MTASFNTTASNGHLGFVPEPGDTVQGTISILYSCLSTLYICTWSSLHMNIPPENFPAGGWPIAKLLLMMAATTSPELILLVSLKERRNATRMLAAPHWPFRDKSLTHAFYVEMRGIRLRFASGERMSLDPQCLRLAVGAGILDVLSLSKDEIRDKSKASWFTKSFLLAQLAYFLMQMIGRRAFNLLVTPIELLTLGILICAGLTYATWWSKPLDVSTATEIHVGEWTTFFGPLDSYKGLGLSPNYRKISQEVDHMLPEFKSRSEISQRHTEQRKMKTLSQLKLLLAPNGAQWSGDSWKRVAKCYLESFVVYPRTLYLVCDNVLSRGWDSLEIHLKELYPLSFPSKDLDESRALIRCLEALLLIQESVDLQDKNFLHDFLFRGFLQMMGVPETPLTSSREPSSPSDFDATTLIVFCGASLLFVACDLLAWNFDFPTTVELWMWRIASICCILLPITLVVASTPYRPIAYFHTWPILVGGTFWYCYAISRTYLIVAVLISFRSMPAGAFAKVDWTAYVPHIG